MEHIAPLIQTILWVGLIAVILWNFYKPLYGLLEAIQKRIELGSSVKAGPFELGDLKPQGLQQQKEKTEFEISEIIQNWRDWAGARTTEEDPPRRAQIIKAKYFQAEDLALRAIQDEFGATVSRQVTAGRDAGFDGAFVADNRIHIVEVKYIGGPGGNVSRLKASIERLLNSVAGYGWHGAQIIVVVVFERPDAIANGKRLLENITEEIKSKSSIEIVTRAYLLSELQREFGVLDQ